MKLDDPAWNKRFAAAAIAGTAFWAIISLSKWHDLANGSRVGSPWVLNYDGQVALFDGSVQISAVIGVVVLNIAAAILGYFLVIRPIWGGRRLASDVWLLFAGIVPGTLFLIALSRIVTLLAPNAIAPAIIWAITLGGVLFTLFKMMDRDAHDGLPAMTWAQLGTGALALLVTLIYSIHIDRFHVMGEGSLWFINNIFLSEAHGIGTSGHWPLISQHYDESTLLYPVVYGLMRRSGDASGTLTALYWIMLSFGRLGIASIIYIAVRGLGVDRLSALVLLAFFGAASLSLNPISSRLLSDSLSPLGFVLNIARLLIPVLPLLLVSATAGLGPRASSTGSLMVAAALGVGLSSMPVHAVIILPWAIAVSALTAIAPRASCSAQVWRAACVMSLVLLAAVTVIYIYSFRFVPAELRAGGLVAASGIGAVLMVGALLKSGEIRIDGDSFRGFPLYLIAICCGYAMGLLLLGNVFAQPIQSVLGNFWPWSEMQIVERPVSTLMTSSMEFMQSPYCEGYPWGHRMLAGHCGSLPILLRTYGLPFVVMTFVIAWWLFRLPHKPSMPASILTMTMWGIVLSLLAMPIGLVLFDFLAPAKSTVSWGPSLSVWLRSRLLEPWFYGGTMLALVLFLREAPGRERRWAQSAMMIAVALYGLSPLIIPAQLMANFSYLLSILSGGGGP